MTVNESGRGGTPAAAESVALTGALERALRELPAGSAEARLTNYCGRVWDVLRSAEFVCVYRRSLLPSGVVEESIAEPLVSCLDAIAALVAEGIERGEFEPVPPRGTARLLVSSLFARAHWCGEGIHPDLSGSCTRAVTETLDIIRPALGFQE